MRKLVIAFAGAALIALLALAPAAMADGRHRCARADRNHDKISDRWECRHHLSLRVKQTRRDQDRDGLNNLGEFRAGTNPRDPDTDNDGIDDDDEGAGTIQSFENGVLTIKLFGGGTLSGQVNSTTEIECEGAAPLAQASHDGGDNSGPGSGGEDNSGPGSINSGPGSTNSGPGEVGEDENENEDENERNCTTADLTPGTTVHEAELENGVFREVELLK
jgi:hypothetical protein